MHYYVECERYKQDAIRFKQDATCFNRNLRRLEDVVHSSDFKIRDLERRNTNLQHDLSEKTRLISAQTDQIKYLRRQIDELKPLK